LSGAAAIGRAFSAGGQGSAQDARENKNNRAQPAQVTQFSDGGVRMVQTRPAGEKSMSTRPPSSDLSWPSISLVPNPRRLGSSAARRLHGRPVPLGPAQFQQVFVPIGRVDLPGQIDITVGVAERPVFDRIGRQLVQHQRQR
jgi:hypothetical protein